MQQLSLNGFFAAATASKKRSGDAVSLATLAAEGNDAAAASTLTSTLTDEQRARIERNRVDALRKKRRASLGGVDLEELLTNADRSWWDVLQGEFAKAYMSGLHEALGKELAARATVLPPLPSVFNAFKLPLGDVRVVILGQDPYPTVGHACGLAFSVAPHVRPLPASLQNIFKELADDVPGFGKPANGDLSQWVSRGVFLLNTTLTVRAGAPASHAAFGWGTFTDEVIRQLCLRGRQTVVFILWGRHAQAKAALIRGATRGDHKRVIISCAHPSPMAASKGFFGSKCFSAANAALVAAGDAAVDWSLDATPAPTAAPINENSEPTL
jgi:uracil-DNA glycosylase